jgi:hypothetical protein
MFWLIECVTPGRIETFAVTLARLLALDEIDLAPAAMRQTRQAPVSVA